MNNISDTIPILYIMTNTNNLSFDCDPVSYANNIPYILPYLII